MSFSKEILKGFVDIHVHAGPSVAARKVDAYDMMELAGEAPVPPSAPEMTIRSALALATPAAMVPTPLSETSLTLISARGLTFFRSKINWARSSIE